LRRGRRHHATSRVREGRAGAGLLCAATLLLLLLLLLLLNLLLLLQCRVRRPFDCATLLLARFLRFGTADLQHRRTNGVDPQLHLRLVVTTQREQTTLLQRTKNKGNRKKEDPMASTQTLMHI
jgi:hypothetical protein